MKRSLLFALALGLSLARAQKANPKRPFPDHPPYTAGVIKPNHVTQAELDSAVSNLYDIWKAKYLKPARPGEYYVFYNLEGHAETRDGRSISEGHGYGLLATVLLAGHDRDAEMEFDGLYRYFRAHPSSFNRDLMAWSQVKRFVNADDGQSSATDGDMDIAYTLLLADKQWSSDGAIDYHREAIKVISAIMRSEINQQRWTIKLGDWVKSNSSYSTGTRSSDFMLQHLKAYQAATQDARWKEVADKAYEILGSLFIRYSKSTGLIPDFITLKGDDIYQPARPHYLESRQDGQFSYNACRTPWRVATDYIVNGDTRAVAQLEKLNVWIRQETKGDPAKINAGYALSGERLDSDDAACFNAPFAVSAMVGAENQEWLNALWTDLLKRNPDTDDDYYGNSVKLLCMIVVSGNWWAP